MNLLITRLRTVSISYLYIPKVSLFYLPQGHPNRPSAVVKLADSSVAILCTVCYLYTHVYVSTRSGSVGFGRGALAAS